MNDRSCLSWHIKQWDILWEAKKNNRLPHALLLAGAQGLGKTRFAEELSAAILCEHPDEKGNACGTCHACKLMRARSHPDFVWIEPEQAGQVIKIDQVRNVVNMSNETAMQGGYRVIVFHPAHAMNQYAANALLKTLEEATSNTLFILISEQNLRLPLTIQSRCQKIIFQKPARDIAINWLKSQITDIGEIDLELVLSLAEGAPLQALTLMAKGVLSLRQDIYRGFFELSQGKADPLQLAAQWQEYDIVILFQLLFNMLRDLLRLQLTQQASLINTDFHSKFVNLLQKLSPKNIVQYLDVVQERYANVVNLQNINRQLLLEELLIMWTECYVFG